MGKTISDDESESSKRDDYMNRKGKRKLHAGSPPLKGNTTLDDQEASFVSQTNVIQHIVSDPSYVPDVSSMKDDSLEQCSISESSQRCGSDFRNDEVKDHGNSLASHELLHDFSEDSNLAVSCKICGHSGNHLEMLLCDLCDEPFHLSCCIPKIEQLPGDDWHCQFCSEKEQKLLSDKESEIVGEISGRGNRSSGRIQNMLRDHGPHTTRVRIGNDYQVEVPEWIGHMHGDSGDLRELSELNPSDQYAKPSDWIYSKPGQSTSKCNWLQCRAVIKTSDGKKTVCGKWRRAPLSVQQTTQWDCSCAVRWDPMHADCAVPQELETKEVFEHLKLIRKMKGKLD